MSGKKILLVGIMLQRAVAYPRETIMNAPTDPSAWDVINGLMFSLTSAMVEYLPRPTTPRIERRDKNTGSAVAMCLLYGITGCIAVMFLLLVTTGAVRAHRHPELYGPRPRLGSNGGRSRVRGIAQAVLETLPIYKFGDPEPAKPDPSRDIEAEAASTIDSQIERPAQAHLSEKREVEAPKMHARSLSAGGIETRPEIDAAVLHRPATASAAADGQAAIEKELREKEESAKEHETGVVEEEEGESSENHLECSICTEDFVVGDDVRVLPCNHKFHPACVDTWLVNISGTCPLCRLNLDPDRPNSENSFSPWNPIEEGNDGNDSSGQTDNNDGRDGRQATRRSRRISRMFDLHHMMMSAQTHTERRRVFMLMQEHQNVRLAEGEGTATRRHSVRASMTERLRERFRVRTYTQTEEDMQRQQMDEQVPTVVIPETTQNASGSVRGQVQSQ